MKIAVLPLNAAEGVPQAYGRQFMAFAADQVRNVAPEDVNTVFYLTQIEQGGVPRVAYINMPDGMIPYEQLKELFDQGEVERILDGFIKPGPEDGFEITFRAHDKGNPAPTIEETMVATRPEVFGTLHGLIKRIAAQAGAALPEELAGTEMEFGTDDPNALLGFLEGWDALNYINQANGMVVETFTPEPAFQAFIGALEKDSDFEGAYHGLVQLARACGNFRIGNFELVENALVRAAGLLPDEFPAYFALGELHQSVGSLQKASEYYDKAIQRAPNDPNLYTRLGVVQMQSNMPVNAERNFRKALEMEGADTSAADFLSAVLAQQGREHEVPQVWRDLLARDASNAEVHAKLGVALINNNKAEEGEKVFENALETLDDKTLIKRFYAPYLTNKEDYDRAMDFYEDALDASPNDVPTLMEYAQTLERAGREFEVPEVLKRVLNSDPDPDVRAQVQARLIELEQPKRAATVEAARERMENGDFHAALRELKPLRNWLSDYWKLWALLSSANNRVGQFDEAEESARRLIEMYPGCEPAYGELVNALHGQHRDEEAYTFMNEVAQRNPQSLAIHINLGLAAARAGHKDHAQALAKSIREAVGQNQELEGILEEMAR